VSNSKRSEFRIHCGLVLALLICISAFVVEVFRALDGNTLSWAYVFEWPLLGGYAVYMWHQLLLQERGDVKPAASRRPSSPADDDALDAFNAYLAKVHENDAAADPSPTTQPPTSSATP
jgi:hypothetical protein